MFWIPLLKKEMEILGGELIKIAYHGSNRKKEWKSGEDSEFTGYGIGQ